MNVRWAAGLLAVVMGAGVACAQEWQQPPGVEGSIQALAGERGMHTSFTLDRDMLASADRFLSDGQGPPAQLDSITFERWQFHEPAFYTPEALRTLRRSYEHAGWKHLVDANVPPGESATPTKVLMDMWLHMHGANIDHVTVLMRGGKEMTVVRVAGELRPLDLVHLGGHFGIPKVDPNAVMVPAPPENP
jgi:hypothetical protein